MRDTKHLNGNSPGFAKPTGRSRVSVLNMKTPTKRYHPSLIFAIGALLAGLPAARAADATAPATPDAHPQRREEMGDRMADELGLSADQRAQMKTIAAQEKSERDALKADTTLSPEDRRAKGMALRKKYRDQRQAVLTPEQRTKADAMREKREKRGAERREERKEKAGETAN